MATRPSGHTGLTNPVTSPGRGPLTGTVAGVWRRVRYPEAGPVDAGTGRRRGVLLFLALFLLTGSWALATPPYAAPDEPAHVFRAADVVRGDLVPARDSALGPGIAVVEVPAGLVDSAARMACFATRPDVDASCAGDPGADDRLVEAATGAARYHPVYYAVIGWPSLLLSDDSALFAMRLLSALVVSLLLTAGLRSTWQHPHGRLLTAGALVGLTPMVLFLGGTVNPNAVEIAGGFAVWATGLTLVATDDPGRQRALVRRLSLAAMAMVVTRTISPLWLLLILVFVALVAGRVRTLAVLRLRSTLVWAPVVGLTTVAAVAWTVLTNTNVVPEAPADPVGFLAAVRVVLEYMPVRLPEFVGVFGWLDTLPPTSSLVLVTVLLGGLVVLAVSAGQRRAVLVLVALGVAIAVVPVVIEAAQYDSLGLFWQVRYTLPFAVGLPMVAAVTLASGLDGPPDVRLTGRMPVVLVIGMAAAQLGCFVWALRRYQVGADAPLGTFDGAWAPRVGTVTVIGMQVLGLVLLCLAVLRRVRGVDLVPGTVGPDEQAGTEPADGEEHPRAGEDDSEVGTSVPGGAHTHAVH